MKIVKFDNTELDISDAIALESDPVIVDNVPGLTYYFRFPQGRLEVLRNFVASGKTLPKAKEFREFLEQNKNRNDDVIFSFFEG